MDDLSITGKDLEGTHVVLREGVLKPEYNDITWRTVKACGGFGCSPSALGSAVFVEFVRDGETARYNRGHVDRFATEEEVAAALALKA